MDNCSQCVTKHPFKIGGGVCSILFIVLACFSIGSLHPTEYGLKYNIITKTVHMDESSDFNGICRGGRHWIWPWSSFLEFPATAQNLEFSTRRGANQPPLPIRAENIELAVSVAFQYKLQQPQVGTLYTTLGRNYENVYLKLAREQLLEATSKYAAVEMWERRDDLARDMYELVSKSLSRNYATCTGLQFLLLTVPPANDESYVKTAVAAQESFTQINQREATLVRSNISVMMARYENLITVKLADANANATQMTKIADAEAAAERARADVRALQQVQDNLALKPENLIAYQQLFAYQELENATMLFDMTAATLTA